MKLLLVALLITLSATISPFRVLQEPLDIDISIHISNEEEEAILEEEANLNLLPYIQADPVLNDIFTFGLDGVIATGISRGRVPNTTFHPVSVSDWDAQAQPNGQELYTFTAVAQSDDGNSVMDTTFSVHYDPNTQAKRLGAYTSQTTTTIDTTTPETPPVVVSPPVIIVPPPLIPPQEEEAVLPEPNEEAAVEVDLLAEIQADPVLNDIFNFGEQGVIASGISRGRIPNTTFSPVSVSAWNKMTNNNGDWYTFTSESVSADGNAVVEMTFTVQVNPTTQEKNLFSYSSKTTTTTIITAEAASEEEMVIGELIL